MSKPSRKNARGTLRRVRAGASEGGRARYVGEAPLFKEGVKSSTAGRKVLQKGHEPKGKQGRGVPLRHRLKNNFGEALPSSQKTNQGDGMWGERDPLGRKRRGLAPLLLWQKRTF